MSAPLPPLSFEFFPPRSDEAAAALAATSVELARFQPEFFSVTFGAGGSTRELTRETVLGLRERTGVESAPHISCVGSSREDLRSILATYREAGLQRLVVLRGDLPSGTTGAGEFRYASELVEFIRAEHGAYFRIEVAAYPEVHPQARGAEADLENFRRKVDAGADGAITQYFYNVDAYRYFVDRAAAAGISVPIVPGVMPIRNYQGLRRFSDMCGAEIPRWIEKRLLDFGDDVDGLRAFGTEVTATLTEQLIAAGAPGLHFYSMNQSAAPITICQHLGYVADGA